MDCLWLAEAGEKVVGSIGVGHITPDIVKIRQLRIDPEWQHTAIPNSLIDRVREYCWSHACHRIVLEYGTAPGWFTRLLERRGLGTPRQQVVEGKSWLEFDLDYRTAAPTATDERPATPSPVAALKLAAAQHPLRVLLADDHSMLRKGISDLLQEQAHVEVVGEAGDGREAVRMAIERHPDVVLMDVTMPGMDGIEATRQIMARLPSVCVIGLSMHEGEEVASAMREAGAKGYLCKSDPSEAIVEAVLQCA
jgi:CheY-like chemotaxis protein